MCYGYAIKAFISNMYDDNILVGGGVFQRPVLYGDFPIQSIGLDDPLSGTGQSYIIAPANIGYFNIVCSYV